VSVAAAIEVEAGVVRQVRLAAGGVATRPWRLAACEAALVGQQPGRASWQRIVPLSVAGARPLSANAFKVELLQRTLVRTLELAGEMS
jgi:xanthine dehydrogenase YagS FAD-binding subunit